MNNGFPNAGYEVPGNLYENHEEGGLFFKDTLENVLSEELSLYNHEVNLYSGFLPDGTASDVVTDRFMSEGIEKRIRTITHNEFNNKGYTIGSVTESYDMPELWTPHDKEDDYSEDVTGGNRLLFSLP